MPYKEPVVDLRAFTEFGALLRYLRRRARLTQRDLGIAVGYSEGHINRFEKNKNLPDPAAVAALFIPTLDLAREPEVAAHLVALASPKTTTKHTLARSEIALEPIPPPAPHEITRVQTLERLRARLAAERRVALCGLPGIGKTTLASALARDIERAKTMPVFWLTLTEGVTTSVDTLIHQLAAFLIINGHDEIAPLISTDSRAQSAFTLDRKIALIGSALGKQPALLCFDNAELIQHDTAWLQVLRHLIGTTSASFLFTSRVLLPFTNVAEITIYGFECDEGLSFIAQLGPHTLNQTQSEQLIEKTGGSPMLLQLAVGHLLEQHRDGERLIQHLETQAQIASYLLETVQKQLSSNAWRLLLLLAVFQRPVNLYDAYLGGLVNALGGMENISEAIVELQRRHLIDDAAYAHLHPLVRDYVYLALTTQNSLQRRMHRLAADWFNDKNQEALLAAYHYRCAGLNEQAVDVIVSNQPRIMGQGHALAAVEILDEVQAGIKHRRFDQDDLRCRLLTVRGALLSGTLRNGEGEASLREAIALTTNPVVRANIICELIYFTFMRSDLHESLHLAQAARAELAPHDTVLQARLASLESEAYNGMGKLDESARTAREALALTDPMASSPLSLIVEIRARAQFNLALYFLRRHRDLDSAMKYAQAALASARTANHPRLTNVSLNLIGIIYGDLGDLDASFRFRSEAIEVLATIGDVHSAAHASIGLANILHLKSEDAQALEKLGQAAETLRALSDIRGLASAEQFRAYCLLWQGQIQEARRVIERVLNETDGKGTERMWGYCLNKLAMIQLVQKETDAAIVTLRRAHDLPTVSVQPALDFDLHNTLGLAMVVAGDNEAAARELADAPRFEGLSCWKSLERDLIEGYVALARGDSEIACDLANQVAERAGKHTLFRQCARQLEDAIQRNVPVSTFPQMMWVGTLALRTQL